MSGNGAMMAAGITTAMRRIPLVRETDPGGCYAVAAVAAMRNTAAQRIGMATSRTAAVALSGSGPRDRPTDDSQAVGDGSSSTE